MQRSAGRYRLDEFVATDELPEALSRSYATVIDASAAPYSYTVALWSAGALLIHFHGAPNVAQVVGFAGGAVLGFTLLGLLGHRLLARAKPLPPGRARVIAGMLEWISVGTAVASAAVLGPIDHWIAWPATSCAVTMLLMSVNSVLLAFVVKTPARRGQRSVDGQ